MNILLTFLFLTLMQQPNNAGAPCANPAWHAQCNVANICQGGSSAGSGCESTGDGCNNCYRGFAKSVFIVPDIKPEDKVAFDASTQFVGYFSRERSPRFFVTEPGPLKRIGVSAGMVVKRINGWRLTPRRLLNLAYRKNDAMRITYYTPGSRRLITATLRP